MAEGLSFTINGENGAKVVFEYDIAKIYLDENGVETDNVTQTVLSSIDNGFVLDREASTLTDPADIFALMRDHLDADALRTFLKTRVTDVAAPGASAAVNSENLNEIRTGLANRSGSQSPEGIMNAVALGELLDTVENLGSSRIKTRGRTTNNYEAGHAPPEVKNEYARQYTSEDETLALDAQRFLEAGDFDANSAVLSDQADDEPEWKARQAEAIAQMQAEGFNTPPSLASLLQTLGVTAQAPAQAESTLLNENQSIAVRFDPQSETVLLIDVQGFNSRAELDAFGETENAQAVIIACVDHAFAIADSDNYEALLSKMQVYGQSLASEAPSVERDAKLGILENVFVTAEVIAAARLDNENLTREDILSEFGITDAAAVSATNAAAPETAPEEVFENTEAAAPAKPAIKITPMNDVSVLQALLTLDGYDAGPVDGDFGRLTQNGMAAYVAEHDVKLNSMQGILDHLLNRLETDPDFQNKIQVRVNNAITPAVPGTETEIRAAQVVMNHLGFKDSGNNILVVDGLSGARSQQAAAAYIAVDYSALASGDTGEEAEPPAEGVTQPVEEEIDDPVTAPRVLFNNSARIIDEEAITKDARDAVSRWRSSNPDQDLPEAGIIAVFREGRVDGNQTPMLVQIINGEIVAHQLSRENASDMLTSGFDYDPRIIEMATDRLESEMRDYQSGRSVSRQIEVGGIRFDVNRNDLDRNRIQLSFDPNAPMFEKRDAEHVTSHVLNADGGGSILETRILIDAFEKFDTQQELRDLNPEDKALRQVWAAQVNLVENRLKDAIRHGGSGDLSVTFEGTGAQSAAVISMGTGELARLPESLFEKIMDEAIQNGPRVELHPGSSTPSLMA